MHEATKLQSVKQLVIHKDHFCLPLEVSMSSKPNIFSLLFVFISVLSFSFVSFSLSSSNKDFDLSVLLLNLLLFSR